MSKTFFIEILTPEKTFFKGDIEMLIVETSAGELGIQANHIPLVTNLVDGSIRILQNGKWREAFNSEGFLEVRPDETILLSQAVEWPEEVDENRAREAAERAQEKLRQAKSIKEYKLSKASLSRAFARLRVKSHMK